VEFCRQSQDDRITLVIAPTKSLVRVLWGLASVESIDEAVDRLRKREGIPVNNRDLHIGHWSSGKSMDNIDPLIIHWANRMGLDAVVWTALPPKFRGRNGVIPSIDDVIKHLINLPSDKQRNAEAYIRKAPIKIDTDYRRHIEAKLGWMPI
jgi:hypothetical protein